MAELMTTDQLRSILTSPAEIAIHEFDIVKNLAAILGQDDRSSEGREFV